MISHWSDAPVNYPLLPARGTLLNIFRLYKLKTSISRLEFKGKIFNFWILWFSSELTTKGFSKKIIMFLYYLCVLFRYIGSFRHWGSFQQIRSFQQIGSFRHNTRLFRHIIWLFRHIIWLFLHIIQDVFDIWSSNLATFGKFNKSWPSLADSRDH